MKFKQNIMLQHYDKIELGSFRYQNFIDSRRAAMNSQSELLASRLQRASSKRFDSIGSELMMTPAGRE